MRRNFSNQRFGADVVESTHCHWHRRLNIPTLDTDMTEEGNSRLVGRKRSLSLVKTVSKSPTPTFFVKGHAGGPYCRFFSLQAIFVAIMMSMMMSLLYQPVPTMGFRGGSFHSGRRIQIHCQLRPALFLSSSSSDAAAAALAFHKDQVTLMPDATYESELIVKKSRFIALARHVSSWTEAQTFVDQTKVDHPKARHWCSAFRGVVVVDSDDNDGTRSSSTVITERCNDDGEPSGTAGQPILNALQTEGDLVNVVCVVVRYFGGIKLGAGGLIRAYGGAARQVLREAPQDVVVPTTVFVATGIAAQHVGSVYDCVSKFGGTTADESYDDSDGSLTLTVTCEWNTVQQIQDTLKDATRGSVDFVSP